jgi:Mrp family chromosome partitioning ATPase
MEFEVRPVAGAAPLSTERPTVPLPEGRTPRRRRAPRMTGTPTLAYLPAGTEVLPPEATAEPGGDRGDVGAGPLVIQRTVSATVTVTRPALADQLLPTYNPPARDGAGPGTAFDAPRGTALAIPPLPPPRLEVTKQEPPKRLDDRLFMLKRPSSPQAASYRSLRHRIAERGDPRTILVTSAAREEGRSACAANLALALAEVKRFRVLLLEADPRRPSLAQMFGLAPAICLLDQVAQPVSAEEAGCYKVHEIEGTGLHVATLKPESAGRALDGPAFRAAIERLRRAYDYVIIDAPNVLDGAEINLIEDAAEAVVLAARTRRSKGRQMTAAIEQLAPANLLGIVLTDG